MISIDQERQSVWARWTAWALVVGTAIGVVLTAWAAFDGADLGDPIGVFALLFVGLGVIGTLIVRRARNQIGWIFVMFGIGGVLMIAGGAANALASTHPFWGSEWLFWWNDVGFLIVVYALPPMFLLFPDGHLPGPRWRWVGWMYVVGLVTSLTWSLTAKPTHTDPVSGALIENPTYIAWPDAVEWMLLQIGGAMVLAAAVASVVALVIRFRRSRGEQRQQFRWLVSVAVAGVSLMVFSGLTNLVAPNAAFVQRISDISFLVMVLLVAVGFPVSVILAVFRYRLYDLDFVITKAVVYGGLALLITVVYAVVVVGVSALVGARGESPGLSLAAAAAVAIVFQPARVRLQRFANRVVYGDRATPYEVLARFSDRVGGAFADDDVLARMAQVLAAGTGASSATVWLGAGPTLRPAATSPPDAAPGESDEMVSVSHRGEVLGALSVNMPPSEPLTEATRRLVEDLAAQAGLVLRNVGLIEDLRSSRQRLVAAQDQERRRLERNIHDGAQQQLVALAVKARLAEQMLDRDPAKARDLLGQVQRDAGVALDDLRDLARGIFPPLLADKGLGVALESQAGRAAVQVTVQAEGVGRYPPDVEATVYFCTLEALQNVVKYANATAVAVRLTDDAGSISFEVRDDGVGFDTSATGYGTGLQGMADRLAVHGGTLGIRSAPGAGTVVAGIVPSQG